MIYCEECNRVIDERILRNGSDTYEIWGSPHTETYYTCPYCGSYSITDELPPECSCCGEYCTDRYISTEDGEHYCINCYTII